MAQAITKSKKVAPALKGLAGLAKPGKSVPKPKTSMTIDSPNVVDLSEGARPKVPPKPAQPQLPIDDAFAKLRTSQA